jgi:hypothetical protein
MYGCQYVSETTQTAQPAGAENLTHIRTGRWPVYVETAGSGGLVRVTGCVETADARVETIIVG